MARASRQRDSAAASPPGTQAKSPSARASRSRSVREPRSRQDGGPGPRWALGGLLAILAWTFARIFAGEPPGSDSTFHLAEIARLAQAMREGDWDWWSPFANSGFADGYYYQVLPQAVPAALSALTRLPPLLCYQIFLFVPLLSAPIAAYYALRIFGADRWVAFGAAVAVPFCTSGNLLSPPALEGARWAHGADGALIGGLYTQLWALVAFPVAFAFGYRWIAHGQRLAEALGWGIFVGVCHPFAGVALGAALAAGATWESGSRARTRDPARWWAPAMRVGIVGIGLIAGSACAWLPVVVDYAGFGGFPHRAADEVGPGAGRLLGWLVRGDLLDSGRPPVLTALVVVALLAARARWLPWLWSAAALYAALLALGPHLARTQDDLLPAVRFLAPLQIMLALGAGSGAVLLARWLRGDREVSRWRAQGSIRWLAWAIAVPLVLVVIGGARTLHGRVRPLADFRDWDRPELLRVIERMRGASPGRLQVRLGAASHWTVLLPYVYAGRSAALVLGGAGVQSSPNFDVKWRTADEAPGRIAWAFDAPLLLMPHAAADGLTEGTVLLDGATYHLRELPSPGLVGPVRVVGELPPGRAEARAAAIRWMRSDALFRNEVLAVAGPEGVTTTPMDDGRQGRVQSIVRRGSSISAEVEVDAGADPITFAVRESWHPRWTATVDGAGTTLRRITPFYMAVDVPAGRHTLALRFDRPGWTWLLWLLWPLVTTCAWLLGRRPSAHMDGASAPYAPARPVIGA